MVSLFRILFPAIFFFFSFPGYWADRQQENGGKPWVLKYASSLTAEERLGLRVHGVLWCGVVTLDGLGQQFEPFGWL